MQARWHQNRHDNGDHPDTASAIGTELGILGKNDAVLVGNELDKLDDNTLVERVAQVSVYARVTAEHKLALCAPGRHVGL